MIKLECCCKFVIKWRHLGCSIFPQHYLLFLTCKTTNHRWGFCVMCWKDHESGFDTLCLFWSALECLAAVGGRLWTLLWVVKLTVPDTPPEGKSAPVFVWVGCTMHRLHGRRVNPDANLVANGSTKMLFTGSIVFPWWNDKIRQIWTNV